jgi:hypothetical protein
VPGELPCEVIFPNVIFPNPQKMRIILLSALSDPTSKVPYSLFPFIFVEFVLNLPLKNTNSILMNRANFAHLVNYQLILKIVCKSILKIPFQKAIMLIEMG